MDEKIGQSHLTQSIKKVGTDIKKKTAEIGVFFKIFIP